MLLHWTFRVQHVSLHPSSPGGSVSKPCTPGEHQNSWDLWMFIPLKMVLLGIDPYPDDQQNCWLPQHSPLLLVTGDL